MSATRGVTPAAPEATYSCTQAKLKELGWRQTAHDETDYRVVAEKLDPSLRVANGLFKRGFHRIEVLMRPDASGNTSYVTTLQSYREYLSNQGTSLEEVKVPPQAVVDQRRLLEACAPKPQ